MSSETTATGMAPFVEMLAERFVTPDVADLVANAPQQAWLLALAWLSRDQECHFSKVTEWRVDSKSGSPAHGTSAGDATNVVRALIGAITPKEHHLQALLAKLKRERKDEARGIKRLRKNLSRLGRDALKLLRRRAA